MDSIVAFAMGEANRGKEQMVFDWDRAALLIRERKAETACAGLENDWEWTSGTIYENGAPTTRDEHYTFLASTWATPELEIDGLRFSCFRMASETPGWGSDTSWPESALSILRGDVSEGTAA